MKAELERVEAAAAVMRGIGADQARVALVLGSGLRAFGDALADALVLPFTRVPGLPVPKVEGHGAELRCGDLGGVPVACLTGRVHLYEGWSSNEVVRALRALRLCGVEHFLLSNAAGGIAEGLVAGDLMRIDDHLNLTGSSPLVGDAVDSFGPRFPDQTEVWDRELGARLSAIDAELKSGVYAGLLGPSYETPAEIRMLRSMGASAVGMSTVHEAMALNAMGARLTGISLISNLAAGVAQSPLSHDEVVAAGRQAEPRLLRLLTEFCTSFADRS